MADASSDELFWRETYFIVFPSNRRPTLKAVEQALARADERLQLENPAADDRGGFASLLVESPEDHAAVEISYETGDAILEQNLAWAKKLQRQLGPRQLQQLMLADARIDVAHFERMPAGDAPRPEDEFDMAENPWGDSDGEDEYGEPPMEMLDPTCLLTVVEALAGLTDGLTIDAAAGEVV
ncbi:MAG: hypothetical protein KF847_06125 [Pirellulales bacterium]|nr:hypothetical protein [Pirellulales bacterium]